VPAAGLALALRIVKRVLLACVLGGVACGGPAPRLPPDLTGVSERFAPSAAPIGQALGMAVPPGLLGASTLARLQSLGAGLVRTDFVWTRIEPRQGGYDFAAYDALVDAARARGIAVLGLLVYNSAWAEGGEFSPPDPDPFAGFAEATAGHFRGRVAAWEIWNEQNLGFRFWQPNEDAAAYGALLAAAYPAVKRGDPDATVVLGGLNAQGVATPGEDYLADLYFARPDLGRSYDALGFHPYMSYPPQAPPEQTGAGERSVALKVARLRAMLEHYGDGAKPIWLTELGWAVYGVVDEAAQARFTVRAFAESLAAGADRVCYYTLDDGAHPEAFPPEDAFGLYRNDGTPKPALTALQSLIARDPSARLTEDRSAGAERRYHFAGDRASFTLRFGTDPASDPSYEP